VLNVFVDQYNIQEENNKYYLIVDEIRSSKEWISSLLKKYVNNEKFELPNEYVKILKAVI